MYTVPLCKRFRNFFFVGVRGVVAQQELAPTCPWIATQPSQEHPPKGGPDDLQTGNCGHPVATETQSRRTAAEASQTGQVSIL
jgi:hypothetical protein